MAHHESPTTLDTLGAILLFGWALTMFAALALLITADRRGLSRRTYRGAAAVVIIGVAGQVVHMGEHLAQIGMWVAHPNSPIRMTPLGMGLSRGFGRLDLTKPVLGMEILHLIGNLIFWAGLLGVLVITRHARTLRAHRMGRIGAWVQGAHCLEHLALTASLWLGARRPVGVSTWFGAMTPGPGLWTYRVWWHFWANAIPTVILAAATVAIWRDRWAIAGSFDPAVPTARPGRGRKPQPAPA